MIEDARLLNAYERCRDALLAERVSTGHWIGELATSALSTATAVSALTLIERNRQALTDEERAGIRSLIDGGVAYLATHQNEDGGWGDTDKSYSNISTTMLTVAALTLAGAAAEYQPLIDRANQYVDQLGRIDGLRKRYGKDKTFAVPILANCALAGLVDWREVSPLPFEAACLPQSFYRFVKLPVVSYAIPALVAIGQARYLKAPPWNPVVRLIRSLSLERSLSVLLKMQPASGGYLEAIPLTSFVAMSLADTGRADHPVVTNALRFIVESVRPDGSWPIDTNLATWVTSLSINALSQGGEDVGQLDCFDWLLACQHRERHPFTGADPGGWGWSDLSGAVPDADDTPGALLALAAWRDSPSFDESRLEQIQDAARQGIRWLLDLQNSDGGWPTFCRGWGTLPFDRSGDDLTAHALRALNAWPDVTGEFPVAASAVRRGFEFLAKRQNTDGSWTPLWFGNQDHPQEENPVYGTVKVMLAYRDFGRAQCNEFRLGQRWLMAHQNEDGGWGGGPKWQASTTSGHTSSVEETALAVEALWHADPGADLQLVLEKGLKWMVESVENDAWREASPIGFYFAKLWYHEKLYPIMFMVGSLGRAIEPFADRSARRSLTTERPPHEPTAAIPPE